MYLLINKKNKKMARLKGLDLITASNGTYFVDDTDTHNGNWCGIFITEDSTVINALTDENGSDLLATLGLTGKSLFKGTLITLPDAVKNIASIDLTSGSANLING